MRSQAAELAPDHLSLQLEVIMRRVHELILIAAVSACGGEGGATPADGADAPAGDAVTIGAPAGTGTSSLPAVAESGGVPLTLSVTVGDRSYRGSGSGECKHADPASIYGVLSSMWMVGFQGDGGVEQFRLTVWRPKSGDADQLGLTLRTASGTNEIDTVTGDGKVVGGGTVAIETRREGGRLVVDGRDGDGTRVRAVVECARFTGIEAVGG